MRATDRGIDKPVACLVYINTVITAHGGVYMLVLSRRESERIKVGDSIVVTVVRVTGDKVRLGIEAPANMLVLREELDVGVPAVGIALASSQVTAKAD